MAGQVIQQTERFWSKVDVGGSDECWPWLGSCFASGYGQFYFDGRHWRAHRLAYLLKIGDLVEGELIHHVCENKLCVNPRHLASLAPLDHSAEHQLTHCARGHEFTPENTMIQSGGWRRCRACSNDRQRSRRAEVSHG